MSGDIPLAEHFKQHFRQDGINIGIGEFVASCCVVVNMNYRRFGVVSPESVFSASSLGCSFGMPLLSSILSKKGSELRSLLMEHGFEHEEFMLEFVDMIKDYYSFLEATEDTGGLNLLSMSACFAWASTIPARSNALFYPIHPLYFKKCHDRIYKLDEMACDKHTDQATQTVGVNFSTVCI